MIANSFWAVICMGNAAPSDKRPLSPVEALARENPTQLMAQLRAFWPQVQEALKAGHTLRLIHQRLNMAPLPLLPRQRPHQFLRERMFRTAENRLGRSRLHNAALVQNLHAMSDRGYRK